MSAAAVRTPQALQRRLESLAAARAEEKHAHGQGNLIAGPSAMYYYARLSDWEYARMHGGDAGEQPAETPLHEQRRVQRMRNRKPRKP